MTRIGTLLAVTTALSGTVLATPTQVKRASSTSTGTLPAVSVNGNAFWADGKRFYVRGLDYLPGGSSGELDPIADPSICKRDIEYFKELGVNTVRIYQVDNKQNHDECMAALDAAGIYLALDVNTPHYSLNRNDPHTSYNDVYLQSIFATIDMFQKYSNTLLFFSGNEVINDDHTSSCAPYVKAVTRDMRAYMKERGYRQVPVGYSAADVEENRYEMATYMNCGSDDVRSDFFSFNDYSWCDPSSFTRSGWDKKVTQYGNYSIPLFLSEYGCNKNPPREFNEVPTLYSDQMSAVYSGGLVYEYSEEDSHYGLVEISGDTVTKLDDFGTFQKQLAAAPGVSGDGGYHSDGTPSSCPVQGSHWDVQNNSLPIMPDGAKKYFQSGAGTGPGLKGSGSQTAGTPSTGWVDGGNSSSTSSTSKAAAANVHIPPVSIAPLVCTFVILLSSLVGASTIL